MQKKTEAIKCLLIGGAESKKSTLFNLLHENMKTTIGVDFCNKDLEIDGNSVKVQVWDIPNIERFSKKFPPNFFNDAKAIFLVVNSENQESFDEIKKLYEAFKDKVALNAKYLLVNIVSENKNNIVVSSEDVQELAQDWKIECLSITDESKAEANTALMTLIKKVDIPKNSPPEQRQNELFNTKCTIS